MLETIPEERDVESGLLVVDQTPQVAQCSYIRVAAYIGVAALMSGLIYLFYWGLSQEHL